MAALAALPVGLRTEADAVMLWNGSWQPDNAPVLASFTASEGPLEPVKNVVLTALNASPADCLNVEIIGPQIIPVQEPGRTTMLVVGSGVWRWSSVVDAPEPATGILQTAVLLIQATAPPEN
jgi:hypothetical protein